MPAADEMTKGRPQYYGIELKIPQMLLKPTCLKGRRKDLLLNCIPGQLEADPSFRGAFEGHFS